MTVRRTPNMIARVFAWSIALFGIGLNVLFNVLDAMNGHRIAPPAVGTAVGIAFLVVGALIASQRPRNPIGWLYLIGLTLVSFGGSGDVSEQYAYYALVTRPGSLPASEWVMFVGNASISIGFGMVVTFAFLLFPDGRLPSPRWRLLGFAAVAAIALLTVMGAAAPEFQIAPGVTVRNPIDPTQVVLGGVILGLPFPIATVAAVVAAIVLVCVVSPFIRLRNATGVERQQIKWFTYGAALLPLVVLLSFVLSVTAPGVLDATNGSLWPLSVAGIPIATAVAILRSRLYDIDVLINRTLVYGTTSAGIMLAFLAGIVLLQALLRPITSGSELAVAASTVASFALFQPLRRRMQDQVDHRFYRRRYDAVRVLDAFNERLRDEVDLDTLRADLLDVVGRTVEPAHAGLWLRP